MKRFLKWLIDTPNRRWEKRRIRWEAAAANAPCTCKSLQGLVPYFHLPQCPKYQAGQE